MKLSRRVDEHIPHSVGQDMTCAAAARPVPCSCCANSRRSYDKLHRLIESVYADMVGAWGAGL